MHDNINKTDYPSIHIKRIIMSRVRHYRIAEEEQSTEHKYSIYDVENKIIYTISSDPKSTDSILYLADLDGQKLLYFYQEDAHLHLTYHIYSAEDKKNSVAVIERTGIPLHHKFKIESAFGKYTMERASGFSHDYTITKDDEKVAQICCKPPEKKGSYTIDINQNVSEQEDLFIIAFAFVLWCAHGIHFLGT